MRIYKRVRDLREDHDKTQKKIAELLHMQLTVSDVMGAENVSFLFGQLYSLPNITRLPLIILLVVPTIEKSRHIVSAFCFCKEFFTFSLFVQSSAERSPLSSS